ncbi:MAG: Hpt domain-containing protein [Candidatus Rokubacteria bacterium]|nr:Hpt domain-containing protein [Candidatus Rokubacteria bacterium]
MTDPDRYRTLFFSEARELVEGLNAPLLALERDPADQAALREAFRLVHTLKSMAAAVGFGRAADLAHAVESVLDRAQKGEAEISPPLVDLLFRAADQLGRLSTPDEGQVERDESEAMLEEMGHASQNHEAAVPASPARPREAGEPESPRGGVAAAQTIRIRVQRLDTLINLAGELLIIKSRLRSIAAAAPADGL